MRKVSNFFVHAFISALLFWFAALANIEYEKSKWVECGEIIHMKTGFDIVTHRTKHSHYDELANVNIIVVDYSGNIVSEEVGDNLYYRHKTGDRICFNRWSHGWNMLLGLLLCSFVVFVCITICKLYKLIFG